MKTHIKDEVHKRVADIRNRATAIHDGKDATQNAETIVWACDLIDSMVDELPECAHCGDDVGGDPYVLCESCAETYGPKPEIEVEVD